MSDLSNPLTQVVVGQAQPAVTVNNLVDALSPAAIFGQNDLTTSGLTWGYYGGRYRGIAIAHGTIALPASEASVYIVAAKATGVVSQSTSITNWNDATNYDRLYLATTGASTITDWDDYREVVSSAGAGVATINEEQIQDIVAALLTAGTNVTLNYNDGDSPATLVINATASGGGILPPTKEEIEDICASLITAGTNITKQYNDGDSPATLVLSATSGGSLTHFTESVNTSAPNASVPVVQLLATNAATDVDIALTPKGAGALIWEIPDNTTTGGNKRGTGALDLQSGTRSNANQVASGIESALVGGSSGRASGTRAVVIGGNTNNATGDDAGIFAGGSNTASQTQAAILGGSAGTASGISAVVLGGTTNTASATDSLAHGTQSTADAAYSRSAGFGGRTRGVIGADAWGGGFFNNEGDYQRRQFVLRQRTTDATATALTTNGSAAAATNQVNIPSGAACFITGHAIVTQPATGDTATWTFNACANNIGGTTALVGAATVTAGPASAGAATWTLGITADDTNDAFRFTGTGEAAHTLAWVVYVVSAEAGPI